MVKHMKTGIMESDPFLMVKIIGIVCIVLLLITLIIYVLQRIRIRKILNGISQMLEAARKGKFQERLYDESQLSAIEIQFASYLKAVELSNHRLTIEEGKVKELIGDISHQTKTPIANLLLYSELLEEKMLDQESSALVHSLREQADKLNSLIQALVKLSRLEMGVIKEYPEVTPLKPMLDKMKDQFQPKLKEKNLTLIIDETNEKAYLDEKWTVEAISNIVDNAIKYSSCDNSIHISITPYQMFCRIDIKDQGIGIKEEEREKIFQRFYRSPEVSNIEGVGIGLYLAREIINGEGGYIKVNSDYKKGTTFSVFLQCAQEKD